MTDLVKYQTSLSGNVVLFCRFLRQKGFTVTALDESEVIQSLALVMPATESIFKSILRAILAKNRYQVRHFDEFYLEFRDQMDKAVDSKIKQNPSKKNKKKENQQKKEQFDSLKSWLNMKPSKEEIQTASWSDLNVLTQKNFNNLSEDELRLTMQLLKKMARKLTREKSRLKKRAKKQKQLDIKRSIRFNMRQGGAVNHLIFSKQKERKLKLVLLCDVSKSMDLYSRFFVHLIYAFQNSYDKIETFVFSTALHRVTEILDNMEFNKAFDTISERVPHWSGGTTIGSCLMDFVNEYGYSMLDKRTVVLILSDGWDTGDAETMRLAMKQLHKNSKKLIWLNPLAGNKHFEPDVIGLKTALPYIDVLAAAHNLESLEKAIKTIHKKRNITNPAWKNTAYDLSRP